MADTQLQEILAEVKHIKHKLFQDNGSECLQSKINRHDSAIEDQESRWKWVAGTLTALCVAVFGKLIYGWMILLK